MPLQPGDVIDTYADVEDLVKDFDYKPSMSIQKGVSNFVEWYKDYSKSKGKVIGARKGKWKLFLPPGAEDFTGLIYPTLGKGEQGNKDLKWWKDNVMTPYNDGMTNFESAKQAAIVIVEPSGSLP